MDDVEAARHDDRRAAERPAVRQLAEDQVAGRGHPDHLQIGIGRQRGRGREPVGLDQEPVAEAAENAER